MIRIRKANPDETGQIAAFYHTHEYSHTAGAPDTIIVAEEDGVLYGVVRLCDEHKNLVLRGMRVVECMRRQGIGTRLLETAGAFIGERECFCIPHRHLESFYRQVGFVVIDECQAPAFLQTRIAKYRDELDLDVILMCKPGIE